MISSKISVTLLTEQWLNIIFIVLVLCCQVLQACLEEERTSLLLLKSAMINSTTSSTINDDAASDSLSNWIPSTDCCTWNRVSCNFSTGHVVQITLANENLNGHLPTNLNSSTLPMLWFLDISENKLQGFIPPWLFQLPSLLFLNLEDNLFTGFTDYPIASPPAVLSPLGFFVADNNDLQGPLPQILLEINSLRILSLGNNNFNSSIFFTPFHRFPKLEDLHLAHNDFSLVLHDTNHNITPAAQMVAFSYPQGITLRLSFCNLSEFPTNFLTSQFTVGSLDLSNNNLKGEVPRWLLEMNTLEDLFLVNNLLTGGLKYLSWSNLTYIDLSSNMFTGFIPDLPSKVISFSASRNQFTGILPSSFCVLTYLQYLELSYNNLTGKLPICLSNIMDRNLHWLGLAGNRFSGIISPEIFQKCQALVILTLHINQFTGPIPKSLLNCSQLQVLDLGNNHLFDYFPYWLEGLHFLQVLVLGSNNIHGYLHTSPNTTTKSFTYLKFLDLSNNYLLGGLSSSFLLRLTSMIEENQHDISQYSASAYIPFIINFKGFQLVLNEIPYHLMSIDISNNQFQGQISESIAKLIILRALNLSHNNFTGHIPSSLGSLGQLESLDLSSNHLDGRIPNSLVNMGFLEVFNVSYNNLTGPIPTAKQFGTFQDQSYLENPGLCGSLIGNKCGKSDDFIGSTRIPSLVNEEEYSLSAWARLGSILMGSGFGMFVGLVMGYFLFVQRTPMWLLRFIVWLEYYYK